MPTPQELREKRAQLIEQGRKLVDQPAGEEGRFTAEQEAQYEKIMADVESLRQQIEREERQRELDREAAAEGRARTDPQPDPADATRDMPAEDERQQKVLAAFRSYLSTGYVSGDGAQEFRDLQAGVDTEGGYVVTPQEFVRQLVKFVDDMVFIRGRATKFMVPQAASLGVPSLDADPSDADWTTELATGNEDSAMKFGKRELYPHPLAKRIKISQSLLRRAVMPVEELVRARLGYKFGVTQEKHFLTGSGAQQPLGLFTASSDGISTSRDVSTGNTATSIEFDGLLEAKYTLKAAYWPNAEWLFHRDAVKQIAKLKDGEGQYLWQPSQQAGQPDLLSGKPMMVSEYVPNTFTSGNYVGMFADYSHYWIADALSMQVQRLVELYAETNQIGFIGRLETDGMPVLEEAFVRVTLA